MQTLNIKSRSAARMTTHCTNIVVEEKDVDEVSGTNCGQPMLT